VALLAAVAVALGLRRYMNSTAQNWLLAGETADIAGLRSPLPQPSFLSCPFGYCRAGEAPASPEFAVPLSQLREIWRRMIAAEPRVVELYEEPRRRRIVYVAHTRVFAFPGIVTV
jgi:hypothetical protein